MAHHQSSLSLEDGPTLALVGGMAALLVLAGAVTAMALRRARRAGGRKPNIVLAMPQGLPGEIAVVNATDLSETELAQVSVVGTTTASLSSAGSAAGSKVERPSSRLIKA